MGEQPDRWAQGSGLVTPRLANSRSDAWRARGLKLEATAVAVPERDLEVFPGPIATSDTALIDAHDLVVDLAGEIVRRELRGQPLNLT